MAGRSSYLPMLATLGAPPTQFDDFAVEAKYDGQRGIAILDDGVVTLLSRNGADITSLGVGACDSRQSYEGKAIRGCF